MKFEVFVNMEQIQKIVLSDEIVSYKT